MGGKFAAKRRNFWSQRSQHNGEKGERETLGRSACHKSPLVKKTPKEIKRCDVKTGKISQSSNRGEGNKTPTGNAGADVGKKCTSGGKKEVAGQKAIERD